MCQLLSQALVPLVSAVIGGAISLCGALVLEARRDKREKARATIERRLGFVDRQLKEFYSPMVGHWRKIKAKSELRHNIFKTSNTVWQKIVAAHPPPSTDSEKWREPFDKSREYDRTQLRQELIPLYEEMLAIFTKNFWLADPTTREWYDELSRFVDLWQRSLRNAIPDDVLVELGHTESRLIPFYQDLERQLDELRAQISGE